MANEKIRGQVLIECPNTVFHLYVSSEDDVTKVEIFMRNIRSIQNMRLTDIYNWCNRQGIPYDTKFNFHKEMSLWNNMKLYYNYARQKYKYQVRYA